MTTNEPNLAAEIARLQELSISNDSKGIDFTDMDFHAAVYVITRLSEALAVARSGLEQYRWRPMSEHPPEMQPVIGKTKYGTVGIAYVYKLMSENPQWNFMASGMNAVGLWDVEAMWMPLPDEHTAETIAQIDKITGGKS